MVISAPGEKVAPAAGALIDTVGNYAAKSVAVSLSRSISLAASNAAVSTLLLGSSGRKSLIFCKEPTRAGAPKS